MGSKTSSPAVRIAAWNVNSVRARIGLVDKLIRSAAPDVLCLQETKVQDPDFPLGWFAERGYEHAAIRGQKNHHGVAILSRLPLEAPASRDWCDMGDARHVAVRLPGGIELHNFYVPAGGDVPDPDENPKFDHKLRFLDEMRIWSEERKGTGPAILVGDLNVAPHEADVWSHKALLKIVSHTPAETKRLTDIFEAGGWRDAVRHITPEPEKLYSWWSYRARDWRVADKGRRLDHFWISPELEPALVDARVIKDARGWERPSDHAPLIADLALPEAAAGADGSGHRPLLRDIV